MEEQKPEFECHVTFPAADAEGVEALDLPGWSFSKIDGDPEMGKGVLCYLTAHYHTQDIALLAMGIVCGRAEIAGLHPMRAKVEHVIYDRRF